MKALWDSIVRTLVPVVVGAVLGWVTTTGIKVDPEFAPALTLVVTAAFTGVYYIAARLLELYVTPKLGWLLGLAKQPDYDAPSKDEVLVQHANLTVDEQEADIQAATSRLLRRDLRADGR